VALIQARPRLEEAVTIALFGGNGSNFRGFSSRQRLEETIPVAIGGRT
jgi:hypothetical protein